MTSLLLSLMAFADSAPASGKVYRWTDEKGRVHYGDKMPPEVVSKDHQVLDGRGQVAKSVGHVKTQAEIEQDALANDEKSKKQREQIRQRKHDKLLLDTFTTERDLVIARDDRLDSVQSSLNLARGNNESVAHQIEILDKRMTQVKANKKDIPPNMLANMKNLTSQRQKNDEYIVRQEEEYNRLKDQFKTDLQRYRELKNITAPESVAEAEAAATRAIAAAAKPTKVVAVEETGKTKSKKSRKKPAPPAAKAE
ncbi:MAG: DUF4124 domain-containing protein [Gammaproteobacteria bacterium]|nr:DUF4124 domain-containing protein [Gammaproteobacteria bacterium]